VGGPSQADIYASSPDPEPDSLYEPGAIGHLVVGNRGRLLDARRTPVAITGVDAASGLFEVEILAFEDAGAQWRVPFEEVSRFQVARGSDRADARAIGEYEAVIARLDREMRVDCDPHERARSSERIGSERRAMQRALGAGALPVSLDAGGCIDRRTGDETVAAAVRAILSERGLADMDDAFARRYVSNPWSGELVKGHAIVLAELGLCPYRGKIVRGDGLFEGDWSKERRAEHLIVRSALTQALWERTQSASVTLYRAAATDGPTLPPPPTSFVSATFSRPVAQAHFAGGPTSRFAIMYRQSVPLHRLFMTFWETSAMSAQYQEAEAVLIGDPESAGL
jgi:hypothetical protein